MFEREDWMLFRNIQTLGQKAGVPLAQIPVLVAKELADNALDAGASCSASMTGPRSFVVSDNGSGIPGTDAEIADLFSIKRSLRTTKQLRLPTRGALGNGLRVVSGAVLTSGGSLAVSTKGRTLRLTPRDDGGTDHELVAPWQEPGTRIEVGLGPAMGRDVENWLAWAHEAILLSCHGTIYGGKSSPHWYTSDDFFELVRADVGRTVRELVADLDGCAEPKAGRIAGDFKGRLARDLDRAEAERLLSTARAVARPVKPTRLGAIGPELFNCLYPAYAKVIGTKRYAAAVGRIAAEVPFILEVWATVERNAEDEAVSFAVNRTPVTGDVESHHDKKDLSIFGCGLQHPFECGRKPISLYVNLNTPFMPITSDGKAPDFKPFLNPLAECIGKAIRKAKVLGGADKSSKPSLKEVVLKNLDAAVAKASDGGRFRYSLRQLFYALRPYILEARGTEPEYGYFGSIIADHEMERGSDLDGIFRDDRGSLYHPHSDKTIPLGSMMAERYERPDWTFNKILYSEKEGFFPILRAARWPERHDCALMTAKGFASKAARDLIDLLGETDEPLTFFCIHDADGPGTLIYQALQEGTRARGGREVRVKNLGLEPAEAVEMGLQIEPVTPGKDKAIPVASYVPDDWRSWLQSHRVELNAMTTAQFIGWLDRKFAEASGKLIPPPDVLTDRLVSEARGRVEESITETVLREAKIDERVEAAMAGLEPELTRKSDELTAFVSQSLAASTLR